MTIWRFLITFFLPQIKYDYFIRIPLFVLCQFTVGKNYYNAGLCFAFNEFVNIIVKENCRAIARTSILFFTETLLDLEPDDVVVVSFSEL